MFNPGQLFLIFGVIPCPAWLFALIYILYSYFAGQQNRDNINHLAHLYGGLMGAILTLLLKPSAWYIFSYWLRQQLS
jgi:membrane associated rhomboid family serine protease